MKVSATIKNSFELNEMTVATNGETKVIILPSKSTGFGCSVNGAELLLLALATCFCNDLYREAAKRKITIDSVEVEVSGEFDKEGETGKNIQYKPTIQSTASPETIRELIVFTDSVAEIHKTLRQGATVTLLST